MYRRILFAVRDPEAARQPGIAKAIQLAKSIGASLELFHALASPVFTTLAPLLDNSIETLRRKALERARTRLAKFAALARRRGVSFTFSAECDYPPHEAVVRRAILIGADLIVAECHKGARTRAWLIHLTDWELLRTSPLPVARRRAGRSALAPPYCR